MSPECPFETLVTDRFTESTIGSLEDLMYDSIVAADVALRTGDGKASPRNWSPACRGGNAWWKSADTPLLTSPACMT